MPKDRRAGSPRRRRDKTTIALMIAAAAVWLVAAYFASTRKQKPAEEPIASAAPTAAASATSGAATTTSAALAAPTTDVDACVRALFPEKAFSNRTRKFDFVCSQTDAVRGASDIKSILVVAGRGGVTQGMRDWAGLEWYSLPAFSLLRVKCCTSPPPLSWSQKPACPVDKALEQFEKAVAGGSDDDIEAAITEYGKMARCLEQFNQARAFGQSGPPGAGGTALKRFLQRAGKAAK